MKRALLTVLIVALAGLPARGQTAEVQKALQSKLQMQREALGYLKKLQNKDGGFAPKAGDDKSSLRATSSSLRAMKYFGAELFNQAACAEFVKSCFDKASGGFADQPGGKPDVATTAIGLMALVELKQPLDPYEAGAVKYLDDNTRTFEEIRIAAAGFEAINKKPPKAEAWLQEVRKLANPDGTFGKGDGAARETGGAAAAVLRLGGKLDKPEALLKHLNAEQRKDGGFGKTDAKTSDLETSYRVMRAYHMLKSHPDSEKMKQFVLSCRNADGGFGVAPGQPSTASGTYFAAIILHWLSEK